MKVILRLVALVIVLATVSQPSAAAQASCQFVLGFAALREQLGADLVGDCLEDQVTLDNGDARQRTTKGEMVWRSADSITVFTDGYRSWLLGPNGLESRLNTDRLPWEQTQTVASSQPVTVSQTSAPPMQAASGAPASIHPLLVPAADTLRSLNVPIRDGTLGQLFGSLIDRSGVQILVGALPAGTLGLYSGRVNTITIRPDVLNEDVRAVSAILVHEVMHAAQVQILGEGGNRDCVHMEVEAHKVQAIVWEALWDGVPPSRTRIETQMTRMVGLINVGGEPAIYRYVVESDGYQAQCDLWMPDGGTTTVARPQAAPQPASQPAAPAGPPISTPTPRPTFTSTPTLPPDERKEFDGKGNSTTRAFTLNGGEYLIKWRVRMTSGDDYDFCFIGGNLERREGSGYWHFRSETARKGDSVRGETYVQGVQPGTFVFEVKAYGDSCSWTISIEPAD